MSASHVRARRSAQDACARSAAWTVALVLLIPSIAACDTSPPRLTRLDEAVEATLALEAVEVDVSGSTLLNTQPTSAFVVEGIADLAADAHAFTVSSTPTGTDGFTADVVASGDRLLVRGLPTAEDGEWIRVANAPEAHSADLALFLDAEAILSLVADLRGEARDEGTQVVRGVDTEKVGLTLPSSRLVRRISDTISLVGEDLPEAVAESGDIVAEGTADVWIDDEGLIRQVQVRVEAGLGPTQAIPGTGAIGYSLLLSLTPVDEAPAIEVPEADATVSFGRIVSPS